MAHNKKAMNKTASIIYDVYFKDEGEDCCTVIFQSQKAQEEARKNENISKLLYGEQVLKIDILPESIELIKGWAKHFNFEIFSEVN